MISDEKRNVSYEVMRYQAIRERLIADDADNTLDEQTLADTLEGVTDLNEMLIATTRSALDDEMLADALKRRIQQMSDRMSRFADRAERRRAIIRDAMIECGIKKLEQPDFTASVRNLQPSAKIIDESLIPAEYWEHRPHLRKRELLDALKGGAQISGAVLSNAGQSLSVRVK